MRVTIGKAAAFVQFAVTLSVAPALAEASPEAQAYADRKCLTEGLYFEAGTESEDGMVAVAEVIFRRSVTAGFPNTVCKVVYNGAPAYGCQFSFACDGARVRPRSKALWKTAWALAGRLLEDRQAVLDADTTGGALFFHADYVDPDWETTMGLERTVQIGRHIFYRPKQD